MAKKLILQKSTIVTLAVLMTAIALFLPQLAFADDSIEEVVTDQLKAPSIYDAASATAGKMTVTLNGYTDVDGYEYQIALNKSFTKGLKTTTNSSNKITISGLKAGKTYYVRARDYLTYDGVKYISKWCSKAKAKVAIKHAKSKIVGKWKVIKSSKASENSAIKYNKKYYPKKKYTLTFSKNGKAVERDYNNKKKDEIRWAATAKNVGYFIVSGIKLGSIKIKGNKLIVNNTEKTWTLVRV